MEQIDHLQIVVGRNLRIVAMGLMNHQREGEIGGEDKGIEKSVYRMKDDVNHNPFLLCVLFLLLSRFTIKRKN